MSTFSKMKVNLVTLNSNFCFYFILFFNHFTVHSVVYLITHINTRTYVYYLSLKFTLKRLKRSYMFRSHDHPQGAYIVPC